MLALFVFAAAAAPAPLTLAVADLADQGAGPDLARNLTDVVTVALGELGVFKVLSRTDIETALQAEQSRQKLGCEGEVSCLAELGGALGASLIVGGSIGKVGPSWVVSLTLTDTTKVAVLARQQRRIDSEAELTTAVDSAARFLVRGLLDAASGDLILEVSESGADVEIDGRLAGVAPLPRLSLPGGPHTIRVTKKGFIAWAREVVIEPAQPLVLSAALVPSAEFIAAYDQEAGRWRALAFGAGGGGMAALVGGIGALLWNGRRADAYERDLAAASCDQGNPAPPRTDCAAFLERRDAIDRLDLWAQSAALVGGLALAVGIYFYTQGPEPGLYDRYKIVPTGNGAALFF